MKIKTCFLVLLSFFCLLTAQAQKVKSKDAEAMARQFLADRGRTLRSSVYTAVAGSDPLFYVFNGDNAYVVISADQRTVPILAYSLQSEFSYSSIIAPVKMWLDNYQTQIENIQKQGRLERHPAWERDGAGKKGNDLLTSVSPLLTSHWGQGLSYNYYCPADAEGPNGHVVTGCVPTALAQLLYYFRFPESGTGSYSYEDDHYGTLAADFDSAHYHYDKMPEDPFYVNTSISTLMHDLGVACDIVYGPFGSGMYNHKAAYALKTHFKYSPETTYIFRDSVVLNWDSLLLSHLDRQIPVYYAGWSVPYTDGHAFICDGYQYLEASGFYYHFNFGWENQHDGYFYTAELAPGSMNFRLAQEVIANAYPDTSQYAYGPILLANATDTLTEAEGSFDDGSGRLYTCFPAIDHSWLIQPLLDSLTAITLLLHYDIGQNDTLFIYTSDISQQRFFTAEAGDDTLIINAPAATLRFMTNSGHTKGFSASYYSSYPRYCDELKVYTATAGTCSDRSDRFDYQDITNCKTIIRFTRYSGIHIHFSQFDVEENNDLLYIYDLKPEPDTLLTILTGDLEQYDFDFNTNMVMLHFITNESVRKQGWTLDYYAQNVGIDDYTHNAVQLFPNPVNDVLHIRQDGGEAVPTLWQLFDIRGKLIDEQNVNSNSFTIDMNRKPAGIYLLKLTQKGESIMKKVIKE